MTINKATRKTVCAACAVILTLIMVAGSALAQPIYFSQMVPTITASHSEGDEIIVQSRTIQLLGLNEEGQCVIFIGGQYLIVDPAVLTEAVPGVDVEALPSVTAFEPLANGSQGNGALALQTALVSLGYLEGNPDGMFGGMTEEALKAFQADQGLEPTGEADALLQMLILSMASEQLDVVKSDPADAFKPIADRTAANLEPVIESGLTFDYDDMAGVGLIYDGTDMEYDLSGESDIDQYVFTLRVGLYVREDESGAVLIDPALLIDCVCARRPMLGDMVIKAGGAKGSYPVTELSSALDGARSVEHAVVILDDAGAAVLAGAEEAGELRIRLNGTYQSFDLDVPAEALHGISLVGALKAKM